MAKSKRKVNINQEDIEPECKFPKTDEAVVLDNLKIPLENLKKPDLLKYCKELELKCCNLEDQNRILEMKYKVLEEKEDNFKYHCGECDYNSDCVHCFADHDHETEKEEEIQATDFNCYYCQETFKTRPCVMKHTKLIHVNKVRHCLNFLEGTCSFSDRCWFLHDEHFKESEPTFNCNLCDSKFKTKSQLMKHKKHFHINSVLRCSNFDRNCKFGPEKCWFLHKEDIEKAFETSKNINLNMNSNITQNTDKKTYE